MKLKINYSGLVMYWFRLLKLVPRLKKYNYGYKILAKCCNVALLHPTLPKCSLSGTLYLCKCDFNQSGDLVQ